MKKTTTLKALVLSMVMTLGFVMPMAAQTDGFFKNNEDYINRDAATGNIINQTFGQDPATGVTGGITNQQFGAPLGSGLLILAAAGAGYAVARRKRARKGMTLLLAAAMLLGMTQCKKNVETIANSASEGVHITLYVGDNGDKHIVHTNTGAVDYTDGDIIYVGNNNKYIGYLTYASGSFSGTISNPSTDDYLHFYFVGGCTPSETPVAGTTTSFSVDISDQSNQMPVLSYVHTKDKYVDGTTTYECMLLNKCGLVKFNLTNTDIPVSQNVLITGMNNGATVHFNSSEPFTYSTNGDGSVILNAVSAQERWAVLPVQGTVSGAVAISSGHSNSEAFTVPAVTANMYYTTGVNIPAMAVASNALTFEAKTAGATVSFKLATGVSMEYSTNGSNWSSYTSETAITLTSIGDKVMFRAPSTGNTTMCVNYDSNDYSFFTVTGDCYVYGNVMSLLYENFGGMTAFPSGSSWTFAFLFDECTSIYNHSTKSIELPATTLVDYCYHFIFPNCSNLTKAPALPATTLAENCYGKMFSGCTSLVTAPELPVTTLAPYCYSMMFEECTNLTQAPALPATTLAEGCYDGMFEGCTDLTQAPALPATTLTMSCYDSMFKGCSNLTVAPALPATTFAKECYQNMFKGCTSLTAAPTLDATTLSYGCYTNMFRGCTSLVSAPTLPATTLTGECYKNMFKGCTSLATAPALNATTLDVRCYEQMFDGCTNLTNVPATLPATTLATECYQGMFSNCTSLTTAPELPATTLVNGCYNYMFDNCSQLNYIKAMFTTTPGSDYTNDWVHGVKSTGIFVKNSAATWDVTGTNGVPTGWTVQTTSK